MKKNKFETDYKKLIFKILNKGYVHENRTGIYTLALFNQSFNINLKNGFPIITGKKIFFYKAYHEYIWIMSGMTTTKYLKEHGIHWWDKFATTNGELGKTYGYQLRNYNGEIDQLEYIYNEIRNNSRRAHITLWNPSELNEVGLPVCYTGFDFVRNGDYLSMSMDFRSSDVFLGLPYDIIFGALMLTNIAEFLNLRPAKLGINLKNAHVYSNHLNAASKYLYSTIYKLPSYNTKTIKLINYKHGPFIEAKLN